MLKLTMLYLIFLTLSFLSIFISGISSHTFGLSILMSLSAISFGLIYILNSAREIKVPKYFGLMAVFVAILHVYLFFIQDKLNPFYFTTIFGEGLAYWLIFFNIKNGGAILRSFLIKLSILYSIFYVLTKIFGLNLIRMSGLFFAEGLTSRHYHIGDLWALTLIIVIGTNWGKFKLQDWLITTLGFIFLIISNARSAYMSLLFAFIYIISKKTTDIGRYKFIPILFISIIIGFFVLTSTHKTLLFSRPYFLQSVEAFPKYPFGVGMGNFNLIGEHLLKTTATRELALSNYTHNIFLETVSGVGVFSILFLIFIIKIIKDILQADVKKVAWGALLIGILINFMFDTTYAIPGLIWILFMSLGSFQEKESGDKIS